jgi:hypothetical protein
LGGWLGLCCWRRFGKRGGGRLSERGSRLDGRLSDWFGGRLRFGFRHGFGGFEWLRGGLVHGFGFWSGYTFRDGDEKRLLLRNCLSGWLGL